MKWFTGVALFGGLCSVGLGQAVPLQIDAVKKSGSKKELASQKVLGGSTDSEAKEKFYEIRVRSMSPKLSRVQLEYMVVLEDRRGHERPGKYEEALISTPTGQLVTMETESVALIETKWDNKKRIIAPHVGSKTFEEELVGIVVVAKSPDGKVLKEHYEPASRKAELSEWLEKARKYKAQFGEAAVKDRLDEGEDRRQNLRKPLGRPKR